MTNRAVLFPFLPALEADNTPLTVADTKRVALALSSSGRWTLKRLRCVPTVTELMGIQDRHTRHGESLCEFFRGEGRSRVAYSETYYREEQSAVPGLGPWHSLRIDNKHKVILDVNTQSLSVYDLTTDPNEKNPVHNGTDSTLLP